MSVFLFPRVDGCYVLDEQLRVLERRAFAAAVQAFERLEAGEMTAEEHDLMKKYEKDGIVFLGVKNADVQQTQNVKKLTQASAAAGGETRETLLTVVRKAVAESVTDDYLAIQAAGAVEETGKAANIIVTRLREWYELYGPEIAHALPDNEQFVESVGAKEKGELARQLGVAVSMGRDFKTEDSSAMLLLAAEAQRLHELKKAQEAYLEKTMQRVCPNVNAIAGAAIGAKLLALAGSLYRLAILPASTIQLLGAEKALFRHLHDRRQRPPKYGVLHEHPLLAKVERKEQGKAARALADKIAIAARVDYFKGKFVGDELRRQLEKRFA